MATDATELLREAARGGRIYRQADGSWQAEGGNAHKRAVFQTLWLAGYIKATNHDANNEPTQAVTTEKGLAVLRETDGQKSYQQGLQQEQGGDVENPDGVGDMTQAEHSEAAETAERTEEQVQKFKQEAEEKAKQVAEKQPPAVPKQQEDDPTVPAPKKSDEKTADIMQRWDPRTVQLVRQQVAKNCTEAEVAYFLKVCESVDLDPWLNEIWCFKQDGGQKGDGNGDLVIFAGRDGYHSRAVKSGNFQGLRSSEVREHDEVRIDPPSGTVHHRFDPTQDRGNIVGAYAIAWPKEGEPSMAFVRHADYNKGKSAWRTHPADMICKVAETKALKKRWGLAILQTPYDWNVENQTAKPIKTEQSAQIEEPKEKRRALDFIQANENDPEYVRKSFQEDFLNKYPEVKAEYERIVESTN